MLVSSDTWPGTGGVLGLTAAQIAAARAQGDQAGAAAPDLRIWRGRTARSSNTRAISRPSASTTCTCIRKTRSARSCGTASTSARRGRRPAARGRRSDRRLQGRARTGPHLAGARARGHVPHAGRRRHLRRRGPDLVHAPGRRGRSKVPAGTSMTTSRSASPISTRGWPSCAAKACAFLRTIPARRYPRRHDRRPEP